MLCLLAIALLRAAPAIAQPASPPQPVPPSQPAPASPEMVIGVYEEPPFAMKDERGAWQGVAVSLWREIARREGLAFRYEEGELEPLLDALAAGKVDAVVGPLLITPHRVTRFDMTSSYMHVSLAIATRPASWGSRFRALTELINRQLVTTILGLLLALVGSRSWSGGSSATAIPIISAARG